MHGKKLKKIPDFFVFFSTEENDTLTNQAKLYRDVLRYGTSLQIDEFFKSRELTKWLLKHNDEFINAYSGFPESHTNINNRIENRLERVTKCLDALKEMNLIRIRKTKATKGDSTTNEYALSVLGLLIGLFLESETTSKKAEIYHKIFSIFELMFEDHPTSMETFCLIFFHKLRDKGLFEEHIDNAMQFFFYDYLSWNKLQYFLCFPLTGEKRKERWELWNQTLEELEDYKKGLFLYQLKIYFEYFMEKHVEAPDVYEISRIKFAGLEYLNHIVIEAKCSKCKLFYAYAVPVLNYLNACILNSKLEDNEGTLKCQDCNTPLEYEKLII